MIHAVVYYLTAAACLAGGARWLRIGQREHYLPGSVTRFAARWWGFRVANRVLGVLLAAAVAVAWAGWWEGAAVAGAVSLAAPLGLSYRGRTAKLAWTRRLQRLAVLAAFIVVVAVAAGAILGAPLGLSATLAACAPVVLDLALVIAAPVERRLGGGFVRSATRRLRQVSPRVVAITGSFGKTSTKFYAAHLLSARYMTMASPASFNNLSGLSRAINERLTAGTQVFVAEMGTYGPGEIRALCGWLKPEIAVITAVGPVHLERMGSLDNIARAKSEILEHARIAVINIDSPQLVAVAAEYERSGRRLIRCSARDPSADVYVAASGTELTVSAGGSVLGSAVLPGVFPGNLACAVGVALAMDIPRSEIASSLAGVPGPDHRRTVGKSPATGVTVIDDTYNSNPEGSRGALAMLESLGTGSRRVLVTPGMVELGKEQFPANESFARHASQIATDIVVVGQTNQRALLRGAAGGPASITMCADRTEAVAWVRGHLQAGDIVLYENDLPDHYP